VSGDRTRRALVLVDHGSRRPEANAQLEAVAERVRARLPDWIVRAAHMELAPPSIDDAVAACAAKGAREIVLHPYFLGPGAHSTHDIPALARAAAARHPGVSVRVTAPLGLDERIVDVVLARVLERGPGERDQEES
jgi:sirohydrochlorin ferrochelatase